MSDEQNDEQVPQDELDAVETLDQLDIVLADANGDAPEAPGGEEGARERHPTAREIVRGAEVPEDMPRAPRYTKPIKTRGSAPGQAWREGFAGRELVEGDDE